MQRENRFTREYHPERTDQESMNIFWFGQSSLLSRVIGLLSGRCHSLVPVNNRDTRSARELSGTLIHDGRFPSAWRTTFNLDFNIHDFGSREEEIVESLWSKLNAICV